MSKKCIGQLYKYENIYRIEEDYAKDHGLKIHSIEQLK
jgi:hypothetical protein